MYVKDVYKVTTTEFEFVKREGIEDANLAVQICKLPIIIIGCLYRHLKSLSSTYDYITDIIKSVSLKKNIILYLWSY